MKRFADRLWQGLLSTATGWLAAAAFFVFIGLNTGCDGSLFVSPWMVLKCLLVWLLLFLPFYMLSVPSFILLRPVVAPFLGAAFGFSVLWLVYGELTSNVLLLSVAVVAGGTTFIMASRTSRWSELRVSFWEQSAKIRTRLGLLVLFFAVFFVTTWLEDRIAEQKVRRVFGLSTGTITYHRVQDALKTALPVGTPEFKVRESLESLTGGYGFSKTLNVHAAPNNVARVYLPAGLVICGFNPGCCRPR